MAFSCLMDSHKKMFVAGRHFFIQPMGAWLVSAFVLFWLYFRYDFTNSLFLR